MTQSDKKSKRDELREKYEENKKKIEEWKKEPRFSVSEVANAIGLTPQTITIMIRDGRFGKVAKPGRAYVLSEENLLQEYTADEIDGMLKHPRAFRLSQAHKAINWRSWNQVLRAWELIQELHRDNFATEMPRAIWEWQAELRMTEADLENDVDSRTTTPKSIMELYESTPDEVKNVIIAARKAW